MISSVISENALFNYHPRALQRGHANGLPVAASGVITSQETSLRWKLQRGSDRLYSGYAIKAAVAVSQ